MYNSSFEMKEHFHLENSPYFPLKKELLLTVLSNFERQALLKESAFSFLA